MIWRWFWREWRSPSLLIVWLSLTLAVACVLALGRVSDRMDQGLSQQSRDFIAADRVLTASSPIDDAFTEESSRRGAGCQPTAVVYDNGLCQRCASAFFGKGR